MNFAKPDYPHQFQKPFSALGTVQWAHSDARLGELHGHDVQDAWLIITTVLPGGLALPGGSFQAGRCRQPSAGSGVRKLAKRLGGGDTRVLAPVAPVPAASAERSGSGLWRSLRQKGSPGRRVGERCGSAGTSVSSCVGNAQAVSCWAQPAS